MINISIILLSITIVYAKFEICKSLKNIKQIKEEIKRLKTKSQN